MNTAYIREGNVITSTETNKDGGPKEVLKFDSCNKAKKESMKMQKANGGLGAGYVSTVSEEKEYIPKSKPGKTFKSMDLSVVEEEFLAALAMSRHINRRSKK